MGGGDYYLFPLFLLFLFIFLTCFSNRLSAFPPLNFTTPVFFGQKNTRKRKPSYLCIEKMAFL